MGLNYQIKEYICKRLEKYDSEILNAFILNIS